MAGARKFLENLSRLTFSLWAKETSDPAGRRNFAILIILAVLFGVTFVPSHLVTAIERMVNLLFNRPVPDSRLESGLVAFGFLVFFAVVSLITIPPRIRRH